VSEPKVLALVLVLGTLELAELQEPKTCHASQIFGEAAAKAGRVEARRRRAWCRCARIMVSSPRRGRTKENDTTLCARPAAPPPDASGCAK